MLALILIVFVTTPVAAITGGQPDGNGHPYGALLIVPGLTFCSGTLIADDTVLTAGHCTSFWSDPSDPYNITEVWITFDPEASIDADTWTPIPGEGTWYTAHAWVTHPGYDDAAWPFTWDYGLVFLDEPVSGVTPAALPLAGVVDELIGTTGQTQERFFDVGYGQNGVNVGGGVYTRHFDFVRKVSEQRYSPSQGAVGTQDERWLMLINVPSDNHGSACGGDSGSGVFLDLASEYPDTVVAVHTGGYRLGYGGRLCGRITSLNHRVDLPEVLGWIIGYLD
jgi:hypothetical protein